MPNVNQNQGNQIIVFNYRQFARGEEFSQSFCDILPYGLYSGGRIERTDTNNIVKVAPLVCVIKSNENDKVARQGISHLHYGRAN